MSAAFNYLVCSPRGYNLVNYSADIKGVPLLRFTVPTLNRIPALLKNACVRYSTAEGNWLLATWAVGFPCQNFRADSALTELFEEAHGDTSPLFPGTEIRPFILGLYQLELKT